MDIPLNKILWCSELIRRRYICNDPWWGRVILADIWKSHTLLNTESGILNNTNLQCYISHLFCIYTWHSTLSHVRLQTNPFYISTISSHVNPSSTFHFKTCVCWWEIRVQTTRVAIGTFFYITQRNQTKPSITVFQCYRVCILSNNKPRVSFNIGPLA